MGYVKIYKMLGESLVVSPFKHIVNWLFFLIVAFLCVLSVFNTSAIVQDYTEFTFFLKDNPLKIVLAVTVMVLGAWIISKTKLVKNTINRINSDEVYFGKAKRIAYIIMFILMMIWILTAFFYPEADQYDVQLAAAEMRMGNYGFAADMGYLSRNPHQAGLVLVSYLLTFVLGKQNYIAIEILNVLMIMYSYECLSGIGKEIGLKPFGQLLVILSAFIFPVLPLYAYFIYGSIPGLMFALIAIKYEMEFFRSGERKTLLLCGLFIALALLLRTNNLIILIAMLIYAVVKAVEKKNFKLMIMVPVLLISLLFQSLIPSKTIEAITGHKLDNGLSSLSYIAMGLQEGERAPGWYNGYNNDSFALAGNDSKKQKEIAIEEIKERIWTFNKDREYAFEFFVKKTASQWNNPTFQVFWNLDGKISKFYTRDSWVMYFVNKEGAFAAQRYLNVIQSLILIGATLWAMLVSARKSSTEWYILPLIFIGGFLFHLFWEAKAQYTFVYFVLLIPYAIKGYMNLFEIFETRKVYFNISTGVKILLVIALTGMFISGTTAFLNTDNEAYYVYINDLNE